MGGAAQVRQGGVAPPDAQVGPPAAFRLHRGDGRGGDRGVAGVGVGDAGAQFEGGGGFGGQGQGHIGIAVAVLGIDVDDAVITDFLGADGLAHGVKLPAVGPARHGAAHRPKFD